MSRSRVSFDSAGIEIAAHVYVPKPMRRLRVRRWWSATPAPV
ncbi:hypothetical protein [Streptomyces sp. NPDC093568]